MRKEKQFLLDEIKEKLSESSSFVLTSYLGMDPNTTSDFRTSVVDSGGLFCVVKKRVFLKAAEEAGFAINKEMLLGHIGIVYSGEDTVAKKYSNHSRVERHLQHTLPHKGWRCMGREN